MSVKNNEKIFFDSCLPDHYAENKLVLLVRDPWWLFAYWEVTPEREAAVMDQIIRQGFSREKTILRVYDLTAAAGSFQNFFDIEVQSTNGNWRIDAGSPDHEWVAELGIKTRDGRFFMLVRSNAVRTPPFGISEVIDQEWILPDGIYQKLLGMTGSFDWAGASGRIFSSGF